MRPRYVVIIAWFSDTNCASSHPTGNMSCKAARLINQISKLPIKALCRIDLILEDAALHY